MNDKITSLNRCDLVVGKKYYRCYADFSVTPAEPVFETLVYLGYVKTDTTSAACEKPYHWHKFTYYRHEYPPRLSQSQIYYLPGDNELATFCSTFDQLLERMVSVALMLEGHNGFFAPERLKLLLDNRGAVTGQAAPTNNEL